MTSHREKVLVNSCDGTYALKRPRLLRFKTLGLNINWGFAHGAKMLNLLSSYLTHQSGKPEIWRQNA